MDETSRSVRVTNEIDAYIGRRLAAARTTAGLSQARAGDAIGLSANQIDKYEKGVNRVPSSRLWALAVLYRRPIEFFFEEIDPLEGVDLEELGRMEHVNRQIMELIQLWQQVPSESRHHIMGLLRSAAA